MCIDFHYRGLNSEIAVFAGFFDGPVFKSSLVQTLWSGSYPEITFSRRFPSRVLLGSVC